MNAKRSLDIALSFLGLLGLSPLLLLIGLAVRAESPGPAIFRQVRIGRGGRPFQILKFRSMQHMAALPPEISQVTTSTDPRITRVGALLRRSKLDELPQLINVLAGDMSLVGPRPEVPRYVALYPPDVREKILSVRPGITDEAAVEFRDEGDLLARSDNPEQMYVEEILPRKIEMYCRYVRTRTMLGDLRIILRTLAHMR